MGFPSPAADYMDEKISLDHELIHVPSATYFLRAVVESRREAIKKGGFTDSGYVGHTGRWIHCDVSSG